MSEAIKALIFDVGGVLVRTRDPGPRERLAAKFNLSVRALYGIAFGGDTWNQVQLGRIPYDEHWQVVGQRLGLAWPEEVMAFRQSFFEGDKLDGEMIDLVLQLRDRYKVALLSNAPGNLRRWIVEEWDLPADTFDAVVVSAEVGVMKPDPEIYHIALARLGVAPGEAIFVDDFVENVRAAQKLGLRAVHFTSAEALTEVLRAWIDLSHD